MNLTRRGLLTGAPAVTLAAKASTVPISLDDLDTLQQLHRTFDGKGSVFRGCKELFDSCLRLETLGYLRITNGKREYDGQLHSVHVEFAITQAGRNYLQA